MSLVEIIKEINMTKNKLTRAFERQGNLTITENDAVTHQGTFSKVLDFFYHAPTRQGQDNLPLFLEAYDENPNLALKALFYLRDVRGGKGQRQTFRDIIFWLAKKYGKTFDQLASYVPEYGRWDDLTQLVGFKVVQKIVAEILLEDIESLKRGESVSLLAKWMPSENASSQDTRQLALRWAEVLGMSPKQYRVTLSELRAAIGIVEQKMSAQEWDEINYEHTPSRAAKIYKDAFLRHDETRYNKFLESVLKGEKTINASTLYPHELSMTVRHGKYDKTIEAQWQNLPNFFGDEERRVLVVVDTSGSMFTPLSGARVEAIDVSVGLGIYCAERNQGAFHNYVLTFNSDSHLVKIVGKTLKQKVDGVCQLPWGGSTNLMSAFTSILQMAVKNQVPAEDMPTDILIISDMEFNSVGDRDTNLERAKQLYDTAGYEVPRVTFWNVNSRNNQVPATQDEDQVLLVSGFSAETIGKVLSSTATNPLDLMLEVLNSERYAFVNSIV